MKRRFFVLLPSRGEVVRFRPLLCLVGSGEGAQGPGGEDGGKRQLNPRTFSAPLPEGVWPGDPEQAERISSEVLLSGDGPVSRQSQSHLNT